MRDYKIVVLGAGGVGKSALTVQFVQGIYSESYDPTIEDSYRKQCLVDSRSCNLEILDTAGVEQFTAMREMYIKTGDGFILVYSVTNESSLRELMELRQQIIHIKDNANIPMVLVANKCDLADDRVISPQHGVQVADAWGRVPFYETSAKYRLHVDEVFVDLVRQIMRRDSAFGSSLGLRNSIPTDDMPIKPALSGPNGSYSSHNKKFSLGHHSATSSSSHLHHGVATFAMGTHTSSNSTSSNFSNHSHSATAAAAANGIHLKNGFLDEDPMESKPSRRLLRSKHSSRKLSGKASTFSLRRSDRVASSEKKEKDCVIM